MGGHTFETTRRLSNEEYSLFIQSIKDLGCIEGVDFIQPFRLKNKTSHGDIDLIVHDPDIIISKMSNIKEIKTIPLFEEKYNLYSKHVLTHDNIQIDFLVSWNIESMEITRAFFSYSCFNIFLKRMATFFDRNAKLSYLGLFISDRTMVIETDFIQLDENTRLVIDCNYIFLKLGLDYNIFLNGFNDEVDLLEFLSSSSLYSLVKFRNNSKFKHDYKRLDSFRRLVDEGLIVVN